MPWIDRISPRMLVALLVTASLTSLAAAEQYRAVTLPLNDVTIRFTRPGRVADIPVKEGERVKVGQLIAKLDDREEQAALEQDTAKAEDMTEVEAQKAIRDQRALDLKKMQHGFDTGAAGLFELDEAKLNLTVEQAKVKLSDFKHDMSKLQLKQTQAVTAKMAIHSPLEGRVEKRFVKVGESVELSTNAIRIVDLSKLNVEAAVAFLQAGKLQDGDEAVVTFSDNSTAKGKVTYIAGVADAGARSRMVRVEVENDWKRPAGDLVTVEFPSIANVAGK
jgi:membrane fusion protein, multidrug efflux system